MRVIIYVEGPSDQLAMETLFQTLIVQKQEQGGRLNLRKRRREIKRKRW